jgi:hypothetical protein
MQIPISNIALVIPWTSLSSSSYYSRPCILPAIAAAAHDHLRCITLRLLLRLLLLLLGETAIAGVCPSSAL